MSDWQQRDPVAYNRWFTGYGFLATQEEQDRYTPTQSQELQMTKTDKFIEDLKANGYQEGDLSTLPSDISEADRRKVEQHEADRANEQMKAYRGQKPELSQHHVELNPNQYGYAETTGAGFEEANAKRQAVNEAPTQTAAKKQPFGGKGDHDGVNGPGGSAYRKPAVDNSKDADKK